MSWGRWGPCGTWHAVPRRHWPRYSTSVSAFRRIALAALTLTVLQVAAPMRASAAVLPVCSSVGGTVSDVYAVPLSGVKVVVVDPSCGTTITTTDAAGRYTVVVNYPETAPGTFSKTGYASTQKQVGHSVVGTAANDVTLLFGVTPTVSPLFVRPGDTVNFSVQTTAPPIRPGGSYACSFGGNAAGQLGTGDSNPRSFPGPVVVGGSPSSPLGQAKAVAAPVGQTGTYSMALMLDGTVRAWGMNVNGQLGQGDFGGFSTTPLTVRGIGGVGNLAGVAAISAGGRHALALLSDGTVASWGLNGDGQLGTGTADDGRSAPARVRDATGVGHLSNVIAVAAGEAHSVALKADGSVWAWGDALPAGTGTAGDVLLPAAVSGVGGGVLTGVSSISAGANHTLAAKTDGTAVAWGRNSSGQLGDNTKTDRPGPVTILFSTDVPLQGVKTVSGGGEHSMARRDDRLVFAWGSNTFGQLGTDFFSSNTFASPVMRDGFGVYAVAISAGTTHSAAIATNSVLLTWGDSENGKLGRGAPSSTTVAPAKGPAGVGVLAGAESVAAGMRHTLALRAGPCSTQASVTQVRATLPDGTTIALVPGTTNASGTTTWTGALVVPASASDGSYTVKVCAVDATSVYDTCTFGGDPPRFVSPVETASYTVDTQAPVFSSSSPRPFEDTQRLDGTLRMTWSDRSGLDPSSSVVLVDGVTLPSSVSGSSVIVTATSLTPGVHHVEASIRDRVGNQATKSYVFTLVERALSSGNALLRSQTVATNPENAPTGPSTVTFRNLVADISSFTDTLNASTSVGGGTVARTFNLNNLVVRFTNAFGAVDDRPVTVAAQTDSYKLATVHPSATPLVAVIPAHTAEVADVTVIVPEAFRLGHTSATATLVMTEPAPLGPPVKALGPMKSVWFDGAVPVVGSMEGCYNAGQGELVMECEFAERTTLYIPAANGTPLYSVANYIDAPDDTSLNRTRPPTCTGNCEAEPVADHLMSIAVSCPYWTPPLSASAINLCTGVTSIPGAPLESAWSAYANSWLYQRTASGNYPVWQQHHTEPGEIACPNGAIGTLSNGAPRRVVGSTHRVVANTVDVAKRGGTVRYGSTERPMGVSADVDADIYLGTDTGNSLTGVSGTPLDFQITNDSAYPSGSGTPLQVVGSGLYISAKTDRVIDGLGNEHVSLDSTGARVDAATSNGWQHSTDRVASGRGRDSGNQIFFGVLYEPPVDVPGVSASAITVSLDFQFVLEFSCGL